MAEPARLLIASGNPHKAAELGQIMHEALAGVEFIILSAADFPGLEPPEETGATFAENALLKAHFYANASGLLTLADDSGLEVDALGGRPGVQSARYAATDQLRIARVLEELSGVPPERRKARFICVAALASPTGEALIRAGAVAGRITLAPRGTNGFGYDPIFELIEPPHAGRTTAELSPAQKNAISHRARALRAIAPELAARVRG